MSKSDLYLFILSFFIFFFIIFFTNLFYYHNESSEYYDYDTYMQEVLRHYWEFYINPWDFDDLSDDKIELNSWFDESYFLDKLWITILDDLEDIISIINTEPKVSYFFEPYDFKESFINTKNFKTVDDFISWDVFIGKSYNFILNYVAKRHWPRWMMRWGEVFLFNPKNLPPKELLAVFIHELGHYIDLFYLDTDIRNKFYDLSWENVRTIKGWQWIWDFVSWYSMTNKYEDFAESFTYYVLHNNNFYNKSKNSSILRSKYNFFSDNVFTRNQFKWEGFSSYDIPQDYYRDITKIDYFLEKLVKVK